MCSKCYKEHVKRSAPAEETVKIAQQAAPPPASAAPAPAVEVTKGGDDGKESSPAKPTVDRTRCAECKKKVGLTGVECRCGNVYCGSHRIAEKHSCSFDYKSFGRKNIEKANERVVAQSLGDKL
jgi:hypothetical protein